MLAGLELQRIPERLAPRSNIASQVCRLDLAPCFLIKDNIRLFVSVRFCEDIADPPYDVAWGRTAWRAMTCTASDALRLLCRRCVANFVEARIIPAIKVVVSGCGDYATRAYGLWA
jgi:hypothetical protein